MQSDSTCDCDAADGTDGTLPSSRLLKSHPSNACLITCGSRPNEAAAWGKPLTFGINQPLTKESPRQAAPLKLPLLKGPWVCRATISFPAFALTSPWGSARNERFPQKQHRKHRSTVRGIQRQGQFFRGNTTLPTALPRISLCFRQGAEMRKDAGVEGCTCFLPLFLRPDALPRPCGERGMGNWTALCPGPGSSAPSDVEFSRCYPTVLEMRRRGIAEREGGIYIHPEIRISGKERGKADSQSPSLNVQSSPALKSAP
jgi:hypothetical protein